MSTLLVVNSVFILVVLHISSTEAVIKTPPVNIISTVHQTIKLNCQTDGSASEILWRSSTGVVCNCETHECLRGFLVNVTTNGFCTLIFESPDLDKAGLYTCTDGNGLGENFHAYVGFILSDLKCVSDTSIGSVSDGEWITIMCTIVYTGAFNPQLAWVETDKYCYVKNHTFQEFERQTNQPLTLLHQFQASLPKVPSFACVMNFARMAGNDARFASNLPEYSGKCFVNGTSEIEQPKEEPTNSTPEKTSEFEKSEVQQLFPYIKGLVGLICINIIATLLVSPLRVVLWKFMKSLFPNRLSPSNTSQYRAHCLLQDEGVVCSRVPSSCDKFPRQALDDDPDETSSLNREPRANDLSVTVRPNTETGQEDYLNLNVEIRKIDDEM